jgi:pimeloyl-ACP methyl ester carboxylesterase
VDQHLIRLTEQIDADLLNVGYAEAGPNTGPTVMLLHGWPYGIHSYIDVAPLLASTGYRMIVPYVRGYARRALFRVKPLFTDCKESKSSVNPRPEIIWKKSPCYQVLLPFIEHGFECGDRA